MSMATLLIGTLVGIQVPTLVDTVFTVGAREGSEEESFARVTDAVLGPDGRLFVLDASPPHVRVFDRRGEFVRMFGRRGQGPGELVRPTQAAWLDSTLIVRHSRTVTEFRPDGEFVRLTRPPIRGWVSMVAPVGGDEHVILKDGVARTSGIDSLQELFFVDGRDTRRLATGVSGGVFHMRSDGSGAGALDAGLCGTLSMAYMGRGRYIVGDGERGELALYDGLEVLARFDVAPEAGEVPPRIEDQAMELLGRAHPDRDRYRITIPRLFSTVCDVQVESTERAWFRRNAFRDDPEEWQAVDLETGTLTESFRLEPGVKVQSIRDGRVAAVWHDDLGVSYVTVFTLPEG